MQKINLVFDGLYADADVLLVPAWVADQAFYWPMRYGEWLSAQNRTEMETEGLWNG